MDRKITSSLEDYLEAIYLIVEEKGDIKAVDIAKKLCVSRASVTEALQNLSGKGLLNYEKYEKISLTHEGYKKAELVVKKHKILFKFFNKILGLSSEESSENACKIEHVITDNALLKIRKLVEE